MECNRWWHDQTPAWHSQFSATSFSLKYRLKTRRMACNDFFAPACVVLPVVSEGKGGGVVASQAIPRGTLLARQSYPLAWASRASPECGSCGGSTCGMLDRHHATTVTACDYCLRPYDHNNSRYADIPQDFVKQGSEGAPAKRCSRCRSVYYCSALCQREAWSSHKEECGIFKGIVAWMGIIRVLPSIQCSLH